MVSQNASQEIAKPVNAPTIFTDNILATMTDFDSVKAIFESANVAVESFDDYGTGFKVVKKDALIGIPMILVEWRFSVGDYGNFVSVAAVTKHGDKVIFNDGSTGIRAQLEMVTEQRNEKQHPTPQAGLLVNEGLTRSDYTTDIPNAKGELVPTSASTYYLAQ